MTIFITSPNVYLWIYPRIYYSLLLMIPTTCYIKELGKLVTHTHKAYFCRVCLHGFSRSYRAQHQSQHRRTDEEMKKRLKEQERNCFALTAQRTEFSEDPVVKFKNIKNQLTAPFVVYADFESILTNLSDNNKYQEHLACSYISHR